MIFWRKKKNGSEQEQESRDDALLHPKGEPQIEPSTESFESLAAPEHEETDAEIIEELDEIPVPAHSVVDDARENEDLDVDHSDEGGWFSRLTKGLGKSSGKWTLGLADVFTKRKLDQDTLDMLEEALIEADLGPKTAARIVADFSKDRFGYDLNEHEIREALADVVAGILEPVAKPLVISATKPYVVLVCGVNGAGKTTTIGKYAHYLSKDQGKSVMIAAADTFRAAAVEQLAEWSKRSGAEFFAKELGADAAAVAYEAYEAAAAKGIDVLMIDTAGRLQNKSNLMAELEKIVRVLKKIDETLPHATLLVLDATTGQNAYSQVETFKNMVNVTGLIVTKLDGSAKGGVLIGLADQFGLPVHAVGVGEGIADLRPFKASDYARSLLGIFDPS